MCVRACESARAWCGCACVCRQLCGSRTGRLYVGQAACRAACSAVCAHPLALLTGVYHPACLALQVHEVCLLVTQRAARLCAAAIAAMLQHTGRLGAEGAPPQHTVVAVDGSMFKHFCKFRCACGRGGLLAVQARGRWCARLKY